MRGGWSALFLLVMTGLMLTGAGLVRRLSGGLRPTGVLPSALLAVTRTLRAGAALAFLGAIIALVPPAYAPALPWMILAAAAALGWSARDVLPDLIGGLVIRVDGRIKLGQRVVGQGVVTDLGLLSATLQDGPTTHAVPNRLLLSQALIVEDTHWPEVSVWLSLPGEHAAAGVRAALSEAALTTPWGAPGVLPQIQQDPAAPGRWRVVMRVIDAPAVEAFRGSLRERALERLG